jgi:hypothetical protein
MGAVRNRLTTTILTGAALMLAAGCRPGVPLVDTNPAPEGVHGTISGSVRGTQEGSAIMGRIVTATNTATGAKEEIRTSETGGFTFKLPPGTYVLDVELRPGEGIQQRPSSIDLNESDLDAQCTFIIMNARQSIPKPPSD